MAIENDDQLVERLVPKVLTSIRTKSKAVETIPVKADLTGITSMPCYDTTGGQYKMVLVSVDSLKEPASSAADRAEESATAASTAAKEANAAATSANDAAKSAIEAAALADEFAGKIEVITEEDYAASEESGTIDDTKLYFVYE